MASRAAAVALAAAAVSGAPRGAPAAQQDDAVTISLSGATFMRNFTTSAGFTLLTPGTQITLNSGPNGTPIIYSAAPGDTTTVQLAARNLAGTIDPAPAQPPVAVNNANYYALRMEWHEQGSIEGVLELINDQVGPVASVQTTNRNATTGNPTHVNGNGFGRGTNPPVPPPPNYQTLSLNGFNLSTSDYNVFTNYNNNNAARPGTNTQGGQNRVQWGISDVPAQQGFSIDGSPGPFRRIYPSGTAGYANATAGYGLGNPVLTLDAANPNNLQALGVGGARQRMNDGSVANMPTNKVDPGTVTAANPNGSNYAPGPWNTAGTDNLVNKQVSVGALAYVANPGTGLTRLNRTDNVWLHTTGRLQNGADFNVVTRDIYSGTANTAANNIGLDISWSVGENDDNNGNAADGGTARVRVGPQIKFSKKTSGSSQVLPTVQNARMTVGHLSSSDVLTGSSPANRPGASRPVRILDYRDDADDLANGSNNTLAPEFRDNKAYPDPATGNDPNLDVFGGFARLTARSLVEGSYEARAPLTYVFVRRPNAAEYGNLDLLKGDNSGNDVKDVRDNVLNAVANFPATSVSNPADGLLQTGFLLPQFLKFTEDFDGLNSDELNPTFDATRSGQFLSSTYAANFNATDPSTITTGTGSTYGNNQVGAGSATPAGGAIPINEKNWFFGDFDQRPSSAGVSGKGFRDYSDLDVARRAQGALFTSGLGVDWNQNAGSNATDVAGLPAEMSNSFTKGDLITLGDFNSDGKFDGEDLRRMARGTALADSNTSRVLSGGAFGDRVRQGVLRKNAALDSLHFGPNAASAQQKIDARAVVRNPDGTVAADLDPTGANAFNKFDVNRDGQVGRRDAKIVDYFVGKDYRNLDDQLGAVVRTDNGSGGPGAGADLAGQAFLGLDPAAPANASIPRKPISLVDVELDDNGAITHIAAGPGGPSDAKLMVFHLQARDADPSRTGGEVDALNRLLNGDANFDGAVNGSDFALLAGSFGRNGLKWTNGDFNFDGDVNGSDFALLAGNFGKTLPGGAAALTTESEMSQFLAFGESIGVPIPEPTAAAGLLAAGLLALRRRRRA